MGAVVSDLFDIYNHRGIRIYIGLARDEKVFGYSWAHANSNGFVTDDMIKSQHWQVLPHTVEPREAKS